MVGALIAYQLAPSHSVIAVVMALGTGLLIGSVSFELIDEAVKTRTVAWVALQVLLGAAAPKAPQPKAVAISPPR